jgi:uncharacterized membrane protein
VDADKGKKVPGTVNNNLYAILSYLWIFCLIPVLMKKDDEFVRFHAKQGLVLFILEMAVAIIGIIPLLGSFIYVLGILICVILSIIGIIQVLMGNKWKIPVVNEWAEKIEI